MKDEILNDIHWRDVRNQSNHQFGKLLDSLDKDNDNEREITLVTDRLGDLSLIRGPVYGGMAGPPKSSAQIQRPDGGNHKQQQQKIIIFIRNCFGPILPSYR
jgi:hypothetical protein